MPRHSASEACSRSDLNWSIKATIQIITDCVVLLMRSCLKYLEKSFKTQFVYFSDAVTEGDHFLLPDELKVRRWSADVTNLVSVTRDVLVCVCSFKEAAQIVLCVFSTV